MDKTFSKKLAKRIKTLRLEKNYTQDELSFRAGISRSTLGNIETAKNDIVLSKIKKIADGFEMTLSDFFNF